MSWKDLKPVEKFEVYRLEEETGLLELVASNKELEDAEFLIRDWKYFIVPMYRGALEWE